MKDRTRRLKLSRGYKEGTQNSRIERRENQGVTEDIRVI
jgi:hypothetical protein